MTSRPKGLIAVAALAVACALPGAARADTDVVLSNESTDTEVQTGASHVVNTDNTSSSSGVDQAAAESTGDQLAAGAAAAAIVPAASSSAPATASAPTQEAVRRAVQRVEALFVGFSAGGTTIAP